MLATFLKYFLSMTYNLKHIFFTHYIPHPWVHRACCVSFLEKNIRFSKPFSVNRCIIIKELKLSVRCVHLCYKLLKKILLWVIMCVGEKYCVCRCKYIESCATYVHYIFVLWIRNFRHVSSEMWICITFKLYVLITVRVYILEL